MDNSLFWTLVGLMASIPVGMLSAWLLPKWQNFYATTSKNRAKRRLLKLHLKRNQMTRLKTDVTSLIVEIAMQGSMFMVLALLAIFANLVGNDRSLGNFLSLYNV